MHVRENHQAQLLPHIKRINGKIVLQLGNWDESVELKPEHTHTHTSQNVCSLHTWTPDRFLDPSYVFVHHFPSLRCQGAAISHGQVGHGV